MERPDIAASACPGRAGVERFLDLLAAGGHCSHQEASRKRTHPRSLWGLSTTIRKTEEDGCCACGSALLGFYGLFGWAHPWVVHRGLTTDRCHGADAVRARRTSTLVGTAAAGTGEASLVHERVPSIGGPHPTATGRLADRCCLRGASGHRVNNTTRRKRPNTIQLPWLQLLTEAEQRSAFFGHFGHFPRVEFVFFFLHFDCIRRPVVLFFSAILAIFGGQPPVPERYGQRTGPYSCLAVGLSQLLPVFACALLIVYSLGQQSAIGAKSRSREGAIYRVRAGGCYISMVHGGAGAATAAVEPETDGVAGAWTVGLYQG